MAAVMILTLGSMRMNYGGDDDDEEEGEGRRAAAECDSFNFMSCSDFASSSLRFISDGEGGDSDSESYIEIQLDPGRTTVAADDRDGGGEGESGEEGEEFEVRISVSSTVPFTKLRSSTVQSCKIPEAESCAVNGSEVPSGLSSRSSKVGIDGQNLREEERGISSDQGKGVSGGGAVKLAAVWRMLNAVTASLKVPPEMCREQSSSSLRGNHRCRHQQLPRSKEASKTPRTRNGARVMQFLFKFRGLRFRTFLASFLKTRPVVGKGEAPGESLRERRLEETLCFHHKMAKSSRRSQETYMSRAGDMETRSCPSSIKCSPINRETFSNSTGIHRGECSMQAAIAHCKRSLTASCDFRFEPHP